MVRTTITGSQADSQSTAERAAASPVAAISNQALARLMAPATATLARQPAPTKYDASEYVAYKDAEREKAAFLAKSFKKDPHQPSTGIGLFGASLTGGKLKITVKCKFEFTNSGWFSYPRAPKKDREWQSGEADAWKKQFIEQIKNAWSAKHTFHCQKDWWEDVKATTEVEVLEVDRAAHFTCNVKKIPPGEFRTSSVSSPIFGGRFGGGSATFDSNDVNPARKSGGTQRATMHEGGHMLGLGDEYGDAGDKVAHSKLVEDSGGAKVIRGSDDRIMSGGERVSSEHGVTFLEVLKEMTKIDEWGNSPKTPPKPVPADPRGDFPTPRPGDPIPA